MRLRLLLTLLFGCAWLSSGATPAAAQLTIDWFTVDGGGALRTMGGAYTLSGTIGQFDAGIMNGGTFSLSGGFWTGGQTVVGVGHDEDVPPPGAPLAFRLHGAVPNPVVHRTVVTFDLPQSLGVHLSVHDAAGRQVRKLAEGTRSPGRHAVAWDGTDDRGRAAGTGIYFVSLDAGPMQARRKVVILR